MDKLYRGGWEGRQEGSGMSVVGGWVAESRQYHAQGDKQQYCVPSRVQKLLQSTW